MPRPSVRVLRVAAVVPLALVGAVLGLLLGSHHGQQIGPFDAELSLRPSISGGTTVLLPPLGSLHVDSHDGPVALRIRLTQVDPTQARAILSDPSSLDSLGSEVAHDLRSAVVRTALQGGLAALLGAAVLPLLAIHRWRALVGGTVLGLVATGATAGTAVLTFDRGALRAPTFTGLLTSAPAVVGDVQDLVDKFDTYSQQLAGLVGNLSKLYITTSTLPTLPTTGTDVVRVLQVSDVHSNPIAYMVMAQLAQQFNVDAVLDTGDSTDHGASVEDQIFQPIAKLGVPYVWVRGNHDSAGTQQAIGQLPNVTVLDGDTTTIDGLTILGRGDPNFTPNLQVKGSSAEQKAALQDQVTLLRQALRQDPGVDIVMMHDPADAKQLGGLVPLVLAGHLHHREVEVVDDTRILVEGSTGGAGLRALQGDTPTPVEASILYFSRKTHKLLAYDNVTVGGLGLSSVTIARKLVDPKALVPPGEESPSPTPSTSPSASASTPEPGSGSPSFSPSPSPSPSASPSLSLSLSASAGAGAAPASSTPRPGG